MWAGTAAKGAVLALCVLQAALVNAELSDNKGRSVCCASTSSHLSMLERALPIVLLHCGASTVGGLHINEQV
jgi:hypothetical protein